LVMSMIATVAIALGLSPSLNAGSGIVAMDVGADGSSTAQLTIDQSSINFASANPRAVSLIASTPASVNVTANAQIDSQSTATLTVVADGDLVSGSDVIPIGKVSWTATGDGFAPGTMDKSPVSAGSWLGPGEHTGTFSFFLTNSWSYAVGNYSQTVHYTLTAP